MIFLYGEVPSSDAKNMPHTEDARTLMILTL
jgi:hypothetical protein